MGKGRTNIGIELASFVGRTADLDALTRLFDDGARAVTLTGAGGIGKTRLARRYGRDSLGRWPSTLR